MSNDIQLELATPETARYLTDRIKVALEGTWQLIAEAYVSRAWAALGYGSWDEYCTREFGTTRLRLPREERQEVVASLRESGLSLRAIAAATGISRGGVQNDLRTGVQNWTPAESDDELPGVAYEEGGQPATVSAQVTPPPAPPSAPVITGADGRRYPASRPQPPRPAPPPPPPLAWDNDEIVEAEIVEDDEPTDSESVQAIVDNSGQAQAYRDAQWRKELARAVDALNSVTTFIPERAVAICDDDLLFLIDSNCKAIAAWHAEITRLRAPGLRVVSGGSR